jgi:hypothetical protein
MDLGKYKIILKIFDAQFNFVQTLLMHDLSIDNFLLSNNRIKVTIKKRLVSERAFGSIIHLQLRQPIKSQKQAKYFRYPQRTEINQ